MKTWISVSKKINVMLIFFSYTLQSIIIIAQMHISKTQIIKLFPFAGLNRAVQAAGGCL